MVVILMGVAGSGKTTVGRALAGALDCRFVDGDDHHSRENIAKMRRGVPLSDADRTPWLAALRVFIVRSLDRRERMVLACSALKDQYRRTLAAGLRGVRFVHLTAPDSTLRDRLAERPHHFARPNLLDSQLAALESPTDALVIDATRPIDDIVVHIRREYGL